MCLNASIFDAKKSGAIRRISMFSFLFLISIMITQATARVSPNQDNLPDNLLDTHLNQPPPGRFHPLLLSSIETATEAKIESSTLYLKANYYHHSGQDVKALKAYNLLLSNDPPKYVYDGFLRFLNKKNRTQAIVNLIDKTEDLFKDDLDIQLIYVKSLLTTNRDDQTRALLKKLKKKYPTNQQVVYYSIAHHEKTNNLKQALEDINTFLEKQKGQSRRFFFYFLQAKIYFKTGNLPLALNAISKSLRLAPRFGQGILFKAFLFEKIKQFAAAAKMYQNFLALQGRKAIYDPTIIKQLAQVLIRQKRFEAAARTLQKLKNKHAEDYFHLALLFKKAKKYKKALNALNEEVVQKIFRRKKLPEVLPLKIELLIQLGRHKKIVQLIRTGLEQRPDSRLIITLARTLITKEIAAQQIKTLLQTHAAQHKHAYHTTVSLADLALQKKQYSRAIASYQRARQQIKNKKVKKGSLQEIHAKIDFQIGLVYFVMNKKKQAITVLEKAVVQKIVYPPTYNLLASLLAEKGITLSRAGSLIDKALTHDPHSPYFLDTKAMILNKQGKRTESIALLKTALKIAPNDPVLKKHLKAITKEVL